MKKKIISIIITILILIIARSLIYEKANNNLNHKKEEQNAIINISLNTRLLNDRLGINKTFSQKEKDDKYLSKSIFIKEKRLVEYTFEILNENLSKLSEIELSEYKLEWKKKTIINTSSNPKIDLYKKANLSFHYILYSKQKRILDFIIKPKDYQDIKLNNDNSVNQIIDFVNQIKKGSKNITNSIELQITNYNHIEKRIVLIIKDNTLNKNKFSKKQITQFYNDAKNKQIDFYKNREENSLFKKSETSLVYIVKDKNNKIFCIYTITPEELK